MVKFDLETEEYLYEQLPNALFGNQAPYQPSAFTDFDFAIDEEGLWGIWFSSLSHFTAFFKVYHNLYHVLIHKA